MMNNNNCQFCGSDDVIQLWDTAACKKCALLWFKDASQQAILSMRRKARARELVSGALLEMGAGEVQRTYKDEDGNVIRSVTVDLETAQITEEDTHED